MGARQIMEQGEWPYLCLMKQRTSLTMAWSSRRDWGVVSTGLVIKRQLLIKYPWHVTKCSGRYMVCPILLQVIIASWEPRKGALVMIVFKQGCRSILLDTQQHRQRHGERPAGDLFDYCSWSLVEGREEGEKKGAKQSAKKSVAIEDHMTWPVPSFPGE